jgi:hypothetical protein
MARSKAASRARSVQALQAAHHGKAVARQAAAQARLSPGPRVQRLERAGRDEHAEVPAHDLSDLHAVPAAGGVEDAQRPGRPAGRIGDAQRQRLGQTGTNAGEDMRTRLERAGLARVPPPLAPAVRGASVAAPRRFALPHTLHEQACV